MQTLNGIVAGHEIDAAEQARSGVRTPYHKDHFDAIGITAVWEKYEGILTWGEGQCIAIDRKSVV